MNASIPDGEYLGKPVELKYPGVDKLVEIIWKKGKGCKIFKRDLTKAYRQIFIDIGQIHLVAYMFNNNIFYDLSLSMGLKSAAYVCQRVTDSLIFIFKKQGYDGLNYLDDLGGGDEPGRAEEAYVALGELLKKLGIWEAEKKACPPSIIMVFLGILLNTLTMTLELPPERVKDIQGELEKWDRKKKVSLKEVQSLVSKLSFAATTVQSGRLFFSRILNFMKGMENGRKKTIDTEVRQDIRWWHLFMKEFDGTSMMLENKWQQPGNLWSTDASLTGVGGFSFTNNEFFHMKVPEKIWKQGLHINEIECWAVLLALKKWGKNMNRKKCLAFCDNEVTVKIINSGRASNKFAQKCLREIAYLCAKHNTLIKVIFWPGNKNVISDSLSRWHLGGEHRKNFINYTKYRKTKQVYISPRDVEFTNDW